jgi:phosphoribosylformylglycinamidine cyclo-ligase
VKGMAHLTGGGFVDNIPRILPDHLAARIERSRWQTPAIFQKLMGWSNMGDEAYRVFNMGIGMVLVISAANGEHMAATLPEAIHIGELVERSNQPSVVLR